MSEADRKHWDERYAAGGLAPVLDNPPLSRFLGPIENLMPTTGNALELACGRGRGAVWLAKRGMDYWGVDVSPSPLSWHKSWRDGRGLGIGAGLTCSTSTTDFHLGPPVDLLFCHLFVDRRLDQAIVDRLAPKGVLVVVSLSEVGDGHGDFRIRPGELVDAFGSLEMVDHAESEGVARILARRSA